MESKKKLLKHLHDFTKIGIALSVEKDINKFFKLVLNAAMKFSNSDGGTIYTLSEDERYLDFTLICTISKKLELGMADTAKWPSVSLFDESGNRKYKNFATYVAHTKKACCVKDAYNQDIFDNSGTIKYDKNNNYRSESMAAIPMLDHENELLGVIQLINATDSNGNIIEYSDEHLSSLTSLASLAAIALTNRKLINGLENLLLHFIKSIAGAIERKSKYTGGHINRVAFLSEEFAKVIQNDEKYYPKTHFSDNEMQEISIAGWMHDVGKITTPIHIRDKAQKLETIFDRIELVMTRFDLIEALIKNDMTDSNSDKEKLKMLLSKLENDREFIINSNAGGEFMTENALQKIEEISQFSYSTNHKTYHLITENEKENLSIKRGTLLPKEMEKIREHALETHEMLSELTYPKKFKNVPLYASSHHEKLNGKGYPFGKTADELPIQSRILSIADLYEALTAYDRPYKKGKTLTETLKIMAFMVKDGEIDGKLLDLFIDSELYLQYAKKYLKHEQLDNVNLKNIKAIYHKQ